MIYNGHDYQPLNTVMSLSGPGTLYLYVSLGDTYNSNWAIDDSSANVSSTSIAQVSGTWYVFIDATYSANGTYSDYIEVRISYTPPGTLKHYGWDTLVGYATYSGPIWKDYVYTIPFQADRVEYELRYNNNPVYRGWSYEIDSVNEICVNEVARDYLSTRFPISVGTGTWYQDYYAKRTFELLISTSEDIDPDIKVAEITFLYDWSYDDTLPPSETWIAMEPLQYTLDSRAYHLFSVNSSATLTNGSNITYTNSNNSRSNICVQLPNGTYTLSHGSYSRTFNVKDNCGIRYCLYYVNSRGGWDSVLVDGVSLKSDKYDRETFTQNYRTPSMNRGVIEYRNNITESWTLYLKSLGDARNPIFHNLFESTNVYLHDLEEGRIVPVVITSREMQYKTRKNQGKKVYTYEITVESSQRKLRM